MTKHTQPHRLLVLLAAAAASLLLGVSSADAATLPDGRVYEMVTPPENHESNVNVPFAMRTGVFNPGPGGTSTKLPFQVASNGEAVAYVAEPTVGGAGVEGDGGGNEYLARHGSEGGWSQVGLQPAGGYYAFYQAFSSDLAVGFLDAGKFEAGTVFEGSLSPEAPGSGYAVLYSHATSAGSEDVYKPLFTQTPTEPQEEFMTDALPVTDDNAGEDQIAFAGASADAQESLFEVHGALTAGAVVAPNANNLYVSSGGQLSLVNILPNGHPEPNATFGAPLANGANPEESPPNFQNVISADGSLVYWTDLNDNRVYLRENPTQPESPLGPSDECLVASDACTVPVSQGLAPGRYWTSAEDGRYGFYAEGEGQASELYRFDADTGSRTLLTAPDAGVQGVIGTSTDGSYVYFVATGSLAANENSEGVKAVEGAYNLYVLHGGEGPRFITVLSQRDDESTVFTQQPFGDWQPGVGHRTAEVTPDGRSVVFESDEQSVEGYSPEVEGRKLEEVYDYEAPTSRLFCVSCSPSHTSPPVNREAGSPAYVGAFLPPSWSLTYLPTWITEDGSKVFFDSAEPLVSSDTNGIQDVYEWERDGSDGCAEARGCVHLLSSGTSESASWLIGSSASGDDVFIITRSQLTPEDGDEAFNVFDARVDGRQPPSATACSETGCQGVPASPPTFATPASVTFAGVGNFPPPAAESKKKAKPKTKKGSLTRAEKLAKALKVCRSKPNERRTACVRAARKRYGKVSGGRADVGEGRQR